MRYKVVFSGLSCMAYLSIIFQKLFYKSKPKRLRSSSKTAADGEANEQGPSNTASNTGDATSEVIASNSSVEKISQSEATDPHTPRNRGTPSTTASNPYVPTKTSDKLTSTGMAKKFLDSTKRFIYKIDNVVDNEVPHTMESVNV
ncbi:hypothetical protein MACJ_001656 [Theileria orientalis]|uniref:Uncharacterized protein n=1 Tax=Theileria orientalis TaxID=68886 RepID=A0A976M8N1_THEOR|nr:hypothetical protein MACJ_001656 [Theileria orientalis]